MQATIRPAAVAGQFYPDEPHALAHAVAAYLAQAQSAAANALARHKHVSPKLLLVPHAGFVYSGAVAAAGYDLLAVTRHRIRRVVLLGPTHRVAVRGLAAPTVQAFETPLGSVTVDQAALAQIADLPQLVFNDAVHAQEHALEVQLPFLQTVLAPGFTLVPLAVGDARGDEVAEVLDRLWGGDETLIVISSDLSHYLPYAQARAADRATVDRVLQLDDHLDHRQACGATPLRGALRVARQRGLVADLLDLRNSGDTAGDRARVVGYAAVALFPTPMPVRNVDDANTGTPSELTANPDDTASAAAAAAAGAAAALGAALLSRGRNAIASALGLACVPEPGHLALAAPGASFVTLLDRGELRGCVGSLEAEHSLENDVRQRALDAAFRDTRFAPVTAEEWPALSVDVSVLDAPRPLPVASEAEALQRLRPGIDGVLLEWRNHRATFLPQVWQQLPQPADFLAALRRKAGLATDFWAPDLRLSVYRVQKFSEPEVSP